MEKRVVEKCWGRVLGEKCCREVFEKSVVEMCGREVLEKSVVKKSCRNVGEECWRVLATLL